MLNGAELRDISRISRACVCVELRGARRRAKTITPTSWWEGATHFGASVFFLLTSVVNEHEKSLTTTHEIHTVPFVAATCIL